MSPESPSIEPVLSQDELAELGHLNYLSARVKELLDRGAIAADSFAAIDADRCRRRDAIVQHGKYRASMNRALSLTKSLPAEALVWAERARELDPSRLEPWTTAVDLLWALGRDDEAVALCAEAAGRFPHLERKHKDLLARLGERAEARRAAVERALRERELSDRLAAARLALEEGRDEEAVESSREVLAASPGRVEALQTAAFALHGSAGWTRPSSITGPCRRSSDRIRSGRSGSGTSRSAAASGG